MARRDFHDWPALVEKAAGLIRAGKCQPLYTAIADALGVSRKTLDEKFRRLGITSDLLAIPNKWPQAADRDISKSDAEIFDGISVKSVVRRLRHGPISVHDLADALDRGTPAVEAALKAMREAGYGIVREEKVVKLPPYTPPPRAPVLSDAKSRQFAFAVASDPHVGSKAAQISALKGFLEIAVKRHQVRHVLFVGDLTAGMGVYRGQQNEVYAVGASEQCDALVNTIPEYAGVQYYMLGGNHDYAFMKTNGFNIVEAACLQRKDWVYLGFDEATVPLTPELDIVLWHPSGGVPYALTYRGQKFAAELAQRELVEIITGKKERPRTRFIFWGHLHVAASFPHGPIRVIGPGCFEGRNGYLKQKGLTPKIQGVVIECWLTDDGLIQRHVAHEYEYVEAEDDWKNAFIPSVARRPRTEVKAMFKLKP